SHLKRVSSTLIKSLNLRDSNREFYSLVSKL
ncbi:hypothetical protein Tco_1341198, partial [Tanacetum coccineum]